MIKGMMLFLIFVLSASQLWADCGNPPDLDSNQKGTTVYRHAKIVFESGGSGGDKTKVYDHLTVWNKSSEELCFYITTISHQLSECFIEGKAIRKQQNSYSYSQNDCQVHLKFNKDKVVIKVKGPRGDFCVGEDIDENNGCGMNASIDSATYTKRKNTP